MRNPFGEPSCEDELRRYSANEYQHLYFTDSTFNQAVLRDHVYLIVGRRGSGKTSLAQFFSFQQTLPNARRIDVGRPNNYFPEFAALGQELTTHRVAAIGRMADIWRYILWQLIFQELRDEANNIKLARRISWPAPPYDSLVRELVIDLKKHEGDIWQAISGKLRSESFLNVIQTVYDVSARKPIIIAIDVMEHYDASNESELCALAALVECAAAFNITNARHGIHLKVLLPAEIYPTLFESYVLNPGKSVKDPVYLHWRPKDLLRLICWRFHKSLLADNLLPNANVVRDWTKFAEVHQMMWLPFFGKNLVNGGGSTEDTFPYILRHTQMRPRQLIRIVNEIANNSEDHYPSFRPEQMVSSVKRVEHELAGEVINSYRFIYPNVADIVGALQGVPMIFQGNMLDKRAPRTASSWPKERYSSLEFRRLVAALGIVGRIRKDTGGVVSVDFEYFLDRRLDLHEHDQCAIHPMFYERLNVQRQNKVVLPFPDHPDFSMSGT